MIFFSYFFVWDKGKVFEPLTYAVVGRKSKKENLDLSFLKGGKQPLV